MMWTIGRRETREGWLRCWGWSWLVGMLVVCLSAGCTSLRNEGDTASRAFVFERDTFAYANELVWEYGYDEAGRWTGRARDPKPEYAHHCFVVARSAKQFFLHARFDPDAAVVDDLTYRNLVREVIRSSPRRGRSNERVVIPGYGNLREFSEAWEGLLQAEGGGAWQSYWQRGHWRMVFPFSRRHQERMARRLANSVEREGMTVVHLVQFPSLVINHAVVLFEVEESDAGMEFGVYDPNEPEAPARMMYDGAARTFDFPANTYFPGGPLDVYEIYRGVCH